MFTAFMSAKSDLISLSLIKLLIFFGERDIIQIGNRRLTGVYGNAYSAAEYITMFGQVSPMETEIEIKSEEQFKAENRARIEKFRLMDDAYMNAFFNGQPKLVQFVLRIIMNKEDLIVKSARTQKPLKNMQGRSITLDVDAVDENGTRYDIEVQNESDGAKPKRARFHSSMMDSDALLPTDDFEKLPETYVIFITSKDYWKKGKPLYTVNRHIEELDMQPFKDEAHIIYVNGEYTGDTPIGKLMHDFKCSKPSEMYYPDLAQRAHYIKDTGGGYDDMCSITEEIRNEAARQNTYQIAMELIRDGEIPFEKIAKATHLTLDEVQQLAKIVEESA